MAMNFAATVDGRATIGGVSGPIGSDDRHRDAGRPADPLRRGDDRRRDDAGRALRPRSSPTRSKRERRERIGLPPDPLMVIVSGRLDLPWDAPLFTEGGGRVLIFTASEAEPPETATPVAGRPPRGARRPRRGAAPPAPGARRPGAALRGRPAPARRSSQAAGLVDDLFLTIAPKLAGGEAPRILEGELPGGRRSCELAWLLEEDGELFARYRRAEPLTLAFRDQPRGEDADGLQAQPPGRDPARARPRLHGRARSTRRSGRSWRRSTPRSAPGVPYPKILVEIREKAKAEGLWNLFMPDERFGPGLTNWEYGLLCEEMGRSPAAAPMAFNCSAPDTGNMEILAEHGTDEQRERWLEPLLEGRIRSCFSMTEPEVSGSDPTLLQARAVRDGDEWVIDGHKWFTSGAVGAELAIAMVVTDPDAHPYARASMICVPTDTPGFNLVRPIPVMGHDRRPRPLRDPLRRLPRAGRQPARRARRRLRDRPGPPRPRPHPPLHAGDRHRRAGAAR